jgi:hypothetical protein
LVITRSRWILLAVVLCAAVVWGVKQYVMPDYRVCPTCQGQRWLSCGAPACTHGRVPCDGSCLKRDAPGWVHMNVSGHSPDELWMRFDNDDRTWTAWTQAHVGQAIEKVDGRWVNKGVCPKCQGTGAMPCPSCHGRLACGRCAGVGQVRGWF